MNDVVVVDENDEVVGTMPISEAHANGTLHRISIVYVENNKGEILIQSRVDGFLDHSAAGHVDPGESYEEAAQRELFEELGIKDVELKYVGHSRTWKEKYPEEGVSHVFDVFKCVGDPEELQVDEVKNVYWVRPHDVLDDMKKNESKYCGGFVESLKIYLAHDKT